MNDNIKAWIDALRSKKYTQAMFQLKGERGYCCLGVACEVYKERTKNGSWDISNRFHDGVGGTQGMTMTPVLRTYFDMPDPSKVMHMNDDLGKTFEEIADYLERTYNESKPS